MTKAKVIEMFETAKRNWATKQNNGWTDTPRRRLARERNWNLYLLKGGRGRAG